MTRIVGFVTFLALAVSAYAVPPVLNYAGQVAVNGEAFDGNGLFKFALVNADGNVSYWSNDGTSANGSEPAAHVSISVNGGLYSLLLGNTAQQGMGAIDPQVFAQHGDAKLRVWFSDGVNGFQQLSPDRPFASVPYAFSAGTAQSAVIADGSINKSMLGSDVIADLNKTVIITRDMLPQDVRNDLNATIGMDRLSAEVITKLDQNASGANGVVAGSLISVPYGQSAPTGYSLYETPRQFWNWQERPSIIEGGGYYHEGILAIGQNIYIACGFRNAKLDSLQNYNLGSNTWQYLDKLSSARDRVATAVLDGKIYVIGGNNGTKSLDNVDIYDPDLGNWLVGPPLPLGIEYATAETFNGKIYLLGGKDSHNRKEVLSLDPITEKWNLETNMTIAITQGESCMFEDRIWITKGHDVFSYDPSSKNWRTEKSFENVRNQPAIWTYNNKLYVAGGSARNDVIVLSSDRNSWKAVGTLPNFYTGASTFAIGNQLFLLGGSIPGALSGKVFSVNLDAPTNGVYDLYRKDGDAPVGTPVVQSEYADGSVTTSKMADGSVTSSKIASKTIGKDQISDSILKYLKPNITEQPQVQSVYADINAFYSVTAEGKYLTYQWKKDGVDLIGEINATLIITDANATLHDGNYSVEVSNDFGSVESTEILVDVNTTWSTDGLVGWWKFDEGSGTVAYDSSENGNDGNLTNGPTWATGKIGGALSFDGVDDYVDFGQRNLGINSNLSVSYWFNPNDGNGVIVEQGWNFTGNEFGWVVHLGTNTHDKLADRSISFGSGDNTGNYNGSAIVQDAADTINLNTWQHVSVIKAGTNIKIYLVGSLSHEGQIKKSAIVYNSGFSLSIGKELTDTGSHYNSHYQGLIDDMRIYDRALSAEEVQALYNLGQ